MISAGAWVVLLGLTVSPPRPNAALSPAEVIRTVAAALQNNNSPIPNAGIFTAYQFASPANRAATGPYGRFFRIVKSYDSAPLFNKGLQEFGEVTVRGDKAEQDVRVPARDGTALTYRFTLSRQSAGACSGCWMVDGVVRRR
jgi:hypothetical protein